MISEGAGRLARFDWQVFLDLGLVIRELDFHISVFNIMRYMWLHSALEHWLIYFSKQISAFNFFAKLTEVQDQCKNLLMSNSQKPRKWWKILLKFWVYTQKASGEIWHLFLLTSGRNPSHTPTKTLCHSLSVTWLLFWNDLHSSFDRKS